MQIAVRKSWLRVVIGSFILVTLSAGMYLLWKDITATWADAGSWKSPYVALSQEGEREIQTSKADEVTTLTIPSCSLYGAASTETEISVKCSLYPSRYFSVLYWLKESPELKSDFLITIPLTAKVTHNGEIVKPGDIPNLASLAHQVTITMHLTESDEGFQVYRELSHYIKTKGGNSEPRNQNIQQVDIIDVSDVKKRDYIAMLFPPEMISAIRSVSEQEVVNRLQKEFSKDSGESDKSPHFTEGLLYGLYLLGESEPQLAEQLLTTLEKKVVPFHEPNFIEDEDETKVLPPGEELITAVHTKFPLCPIQAVTSAQWDSPSIKLFMAYQRYQPQTSANYNIPDQPLYDRGGNLLQYDNMLALDDYCRQVIESKKSEQQKVLRKWYDEYVKQHFSYGASTGSGMVVMEGSDLLRGVVLRGLASDPNIARQNISLASVKRSLFDGILWVYLYGK